MKLLTIIEKIKRFSNQDLALYLLIISSFLPFYLFLTLFVLYIILLAFTGKLKQVFKDLHSTRSYWRLSDLALSYRW